MTDIVGIYGLDQDLETTASIGIFNHTRRLMQALAESPDPGFRIILFLSSYNRASLCPGSLPPWMTAVVVPGRFHTGLKRLWGDHVTAIRLAAAHGVRAMHFPKGWIPLFRPRSVRIIATVHDAINEYLDRRYPAHATALRKAYFRWTRRHALRRADRIITVSHFSRSQLLQVDPSAEARLSVIHQGPDRPGEAVGLPEKREGILVMGSMIPHKATEETFRLLDRFAAEQAAGLRVNVTGLSEWPEPWSPRPSHLDLSFHGRIPEESLIQLWRSSRALVFLSEMEGFGLPLVEAYAAGTPACYRAAAYAKEIMEGLPGGWNGTGYDAFAESLKTVLALAPPEIAAIRRRLLDRFNWHTAARQTLDLYREVLAAARGI